MIQWFLVWLLAFCSICEGANKQPPPRPKPWQAERVKTPPLRSLKSTPLVAGFSSPVSPTPPIVIDAGHGGTDRGACAKSPFCEEKRICLQTARLVQKYLDQLGYRVVMTRTTDAFIPLARRVEIAQQASASLFVSIHYNSSRSILANGVEVFFTDSQEEKARSASSKKLAESILSKIIRRTSAASRGVKKGNFYVIRETSMPAVIVEGGFISNDEERSNLKDREYLDKIARGIADGIDQFLKKGKGAGRF